MKAMLRNSVLAATLAVTSFVTLPAEAAGPMPAPETIGRSDVDLVRHRGYCSPRDALRRAWRLGFHRSRVERVAHSRIVVVGWRRGYMSRVVFANAYGCPRIG
ncbi:MULTISPECIES: hypothetical protein [unclassified Ensifer]|uniref:hypothetical protein n=1 Tax=unclassified Ensifer TaxID=2633371 RepID=UPI00081390CC|nr:MULTISPECIES: hypothetical protein [unclassified Ensifer]OCP09260.1 hypothetical protein BC374_01425 [Ensifer sp. LC13]OCP10442.1 hypothetical protein BBX50_01775 [Ensifer sp. LC11]OCP13952.1 hypothetical protein BC362_04180 [Ensifer sp. LC14]OCP32508.1 hypothetical protein BC364_01425 [Ensifer sp. LC499]